MATYTSSNYTRRAILTSVGIGSVTLMAGCLGGSTDDDEETTGGASSDGEGSDDAIDDEQYLANYEEYLASEGISLRELELADDREVVTVEYESANLHDEFELADEIGHISGGYMQQLEDDWDVDRLEATIYDDVGEVGTWYMEREWFKKMEDGELTPDELSLEVLETVDMTV